MIERALAIGKDAARYPLRGRGPWVIGWTVAVAWALGSIPVSNVLLYIGAIGLSVVCAAYWVDFASDVTATSAEGEDVPPRWPDVREYESVLWSSARTTVLMLACFAIPTFVLFVTDGIDAAMVVLILFGIVYFPTAFTEAAAGKSLVTLLPHVVFPAIARAGRLAALTSAALLVFALALVIAWWCATRVPWIGRPLGALVAAFTAMATARVFGLVRRDPSAAKTPKESP